MPVVEMQSLRARVAGQSAMGRIVDGAVGSAGIRPMRRLFGASPLGAANEDRFRGVLGKLIAGAALDVLGPEWDVLHAVPAGTGDIDHVVVGPGGVFTLTVGSSPGQDVWVDGKTLYIGGTRQLGADGAGLEARLASSLLSAATGARVQVKAVLVVVEPRRLTVRTQPCKAEVVSSHDIVGFLRAQPRVLTGAQVAALSDVADRPSTWRGSLSTAADADRTRQNFSRLRDEVRLAARRRRRWAVISFVALCSASCTAVGTVLGPYLT